MCFSPDCSLSHLGVCCYHYPFSPLSFSSLRCSHTYWDPERSDVKLAQAIMLKRLINRISDHVRNSVILCGDFNSMPDSDSK